MARYFANTNSFIQLHVTGELPLNNRAGWITVQLASASFVSIDSTTDEASTGWTRSDNVDEATFDTPASCIRDRYALFSLRTDQRKIASAVLKAQVAKEEKKYLVDNPNFRRPPKQKREEIKDAVKAKLLAKADPIPSVVDASWNTDNGVLTLYSTSPSVIDRFAEQFSKTFPGLTLSVIHPFARATNLLDGTLLDALNEANQANSDAVSAMIRDNCWIGDDFLLWLLYRGLNGEGEYLTNVPGHTGTGETFSAWIDDKIVMQGGSEEGGMQKVAISGSQDKYTEVRTALAMAKSITSGTIFVEHGENEWRISLVGNSFAFKSFKCPNVRIEKDATVDELSELEAVFFEKMYLIEQGLQFFDSMFKQFLAERLGSEWGGKQAAIRSWITPEATAIYP